MIFFKFDFISESKVYFERIKNLLWNNSNYDIDYNQISELYLTYLQILVDKNLISHDDKLTFFKFILCLIQCI